MKKKKHQEYLLTEHLYSKKKNDMKSATEVISLGQFFTCSSCWIRVTHVAGGRSGTWVEAISLGWWLVGIARGCRWRWAIAVHHAR